MIINCPGAIMFDFICFKIIEKVNGICFDSYENVCKKQNYTTADLRIFNRPIMKSFLIDDFSTPFFHHHHFISNEKKIKIKFNKFSFIF